MMAVYNETRDEARLRRHRAAASSLRDQLFPRLSHQQQRDEEEGFSQLDTMLSQSTQERLDILNSTHLSDEGKRNRISEITQRDLKVLDRYAGVTQKLSDKLDEMRRVALHGLVPHEGGYVARKPTPKEDVHRVQDLLMRQDDRRRRDIYFDACR
jgi:hypothetical protein